MLYMEDVPLLEFHRSQAVLVVSYLVFTIKSAGNFWNFPQHTICQYSILYILGLTPTQ